MSGWSRDQNQRLVQREASVGGSGGGDSRSDSARDRLRSRSRSTGLQESVHSQDVAGLPDRQLVLYKPPDLPPPVSLVVFTFPCSSSDLSRNQTWTTPCVRSGMEWNS